MKSINRFALIVRPGAPFIEWAARTFHEPEAKARQEILSGEPSVYLLAESTAPDADHPALLKSCWRSIFKEELEAWCVLEERWPQKRTEALFRAWFNIELCTIVFDLGKSKIEHEAF
ncbi:MAG: hypothetical protein Q8K67_10455 [Geothrix sp.]|nr:hypothetical protein [Geothrix sp.]